MLLADSYGGLDNPSFSFERVGMRGHLPSHWPNLGLADPPAHSEQEQVAHALSGINNCHYRVASELVGPAVLLPRTIPPFKMTRWIHR